MTDRSITLSDFGRDYLGGKSAKTAKARVLNDGIPHVVDGGHILILESDAKAWRDSRRTETAPPSIKTLLASIAAKTLQARRPNGH